MEFLEELWDETTDFIEDFWEHATKRHPTKPKAQRETVIAGHLATVRPAYLFAERIDNTIKIVFGVSILISAITASFLGFQTLSDLLEVLITTIWGRIIMLFIGFSYFIIALWKLMHLKNKN